MRGAERWFHTVVVVGASLSGCGGLSSDPAPSDAAGSGGSGAGAPPGAGSGGSSAGAGGTIAIGGEGGTGGTIVIGSGGAAGLRGYGGGPTDHPDDCATDAEFTCSDYASLSDCRCDLEAPTEQSDCPSLFALTCTEYSPDPVNPYPPRYVGCTCAETFLEPSDCATPGQFICVETPAGFANCGCDDTLPTSPESCSRSQIWRCQSSDPMFGCTCECCVIV